MNYSTCHICNSTTKKITVTVSPTYSRTNVYSLSMNCYLITYFNHQLRAFGIKIKYKPPYIKLPFFPPEKRRSHFMFNVYYDKLYKQLSLFIKLPYLIISRIS